MALIRLIGPLGPGVKDRVGAVPTMEKKRAGHPVVPSGGRVLVQ